VSARNPAARKPALPADPQTHEMTVSYLGPHMPSLRLQGRWLERAGFPVGTRVHVDVSPRRLIVEAIEHEDLALCAVAEPSRETKPAKRRRF
jgi:Toxin SymE, type I toxin-antitoxin system